MKPPGFITLIFLSLTWPLAAQTSAPREVQSHGVLFEDWVRQTFFNHYQPPSYTQKWDIPKEANLQHGGIPVNPKATQYGTPVGLGDALRQFDIQEPFMLIIGYWKEEGSNKRFVKVLTPVVSPETWRKLWFPITRDDLLKLDAIVKDRSLDYLDARRLAQTMKSKPPFSEAIITINPKIDGLGQHRLQCSLSFAKVLKYLAPGTDSAEEVDPKLFGTSLPGPFHSPPREFTRPTAPDAKGSRD